MKHPILVVLTLAACAAALDGTALAKGGKSNRVRDRITLTAQAFAGRARLQIRRDAPDRQELRLQVTGAAAGLDLRVYVENATGVLTEVAAMTEDGSGEYVWRVRTKKGDALPFGQADLSGLSGRKIEVRTAAGATAFAAAFPVIAPAAAPKLAKKALRNNLAVNGAVAGAIGDPRLAASAAVSLRRGGHQRFGVRIANAMTGQKFEVWIEDPVTGNMKLLSLVTTGAPKAAKDGGASGGSDDGDLDDDGIADENEGEVEIDTDAGDDLPDAAESVSDLAGLEVEVRTESGDVVAEGEIPAVGDTPRPDDDDHDGVEDGTED